MRFLRFKNRGSFAFSKKTKKVIICRRQWLQLWFNCSLLSPTSLPSIFLVKTFSPLIKSLVLGLKC